MFIQSVNGAFIDPSGPAHKLSGMHDSMSRLLSFAREATAAHPPQRRILDFQAVGQRLGVSSAVMTNWKARGISKDGAFDAQRAFGCNAWWLLTGDGVSAVGGWPFERVSKSRWDACDPGDRGYVQAAMNRALDDCEASRKQAHRSA